MLSLKAPFICTLSNDSVSLKLQLCLISWQYRQTTEKPDVEGKYHNTDVYSSAFHTKDPHTLDPPKLQTLPLCFSALSSPNASYGPLRNAPARFGNIIKGVRDANGGQKGWHQADFTPGPRMARPKPGSHYARQIKKTAAHTQTGPAKQRKGW